MTLKKVQVGSLHPNPYRDFDNYPFVESKIESLRESYRQTTYWGNIIARPRKKGGYEAAFGHHRIEALEREYGKNHLVEIVVRDLSNEMMLKMMARENQDEWGTSADIEAETARATIKAYANGDFDFEIMPEDTRKSYIRNAPFFIPGDVYQNSGTRTYIMMQVAEFLGWTRKGGSTGTQPNEKCIVAFATLEAQERKLINNKTLRGLSRNQSKIITEEAQRESRKGDSEARKLNAEGKVDEAKKARKEGERRAKKKAEAGRKAINNGAGVRDLKKEMRSAVPDDASGIESQPPSIVENALKVQDEINKLLADDRLGANLEVLCEWSGSIPMGTRRSLSHALKVLSDRSLKLSGKLYSKKGVLK